MRVGEIVARVNDAVKIRAFVNDVALDLVVSALVVAFSVTMMALHAPWLALLALASAPLYWAIYQTASTLNRRHQRALAERTAELESQLVESVAAAATIKRFAAEPAAELRTETRLVGLLRAVYAAAAVSLGSAVGAELLSRLLSVALLWTGSRLVLDRALTPGGLMSCYALLAYLTVPLGRLVGMGRAAQEALVAAERLFRGHGPRMRGRRAPSRHRAGDGRGPALRPRLGAPRRPVARAARGELRRAPRRDHRGGGRERVGKSTLAGVAQRHLPRGRRAGVDRRARRRRSWVSAASAARSASCRSGSSSSRGRSSRTSPSAIPPPTCGASRSCAAAWGLGETLAGLPHGLFHGGRRARGRALGRAAAARRARPRAVTTAPPSSCSTRPPRRSTRWPSVRCWACCGSVAREGRVGAARGASAEQRGAGGPHRGARRGARRRGGEPRRAAAARRRYGRLWAHQHPAPVEEAA
jgi:hypothetical protein